MLVSPHAVTDRKVLHFCSGTGAGLRLLPAEAALLCWVLCCGIQNLTVTRSPVEVIRMDIHRQILCGRGCGGVRKKSCIRLTTPMHCCTCAGRTPKLTSLIQSVTYHAASMLLWVSIQDIQHQPKTDRTASVRPSTGRLTESDRASSLSDWNDSLGGINFGQRNSQLN